MSVISSVFTRSNGIEIPAIGFKTSPLKDEDIIKLKAITL